MMDDIVREKGRLQLGIWQGIYFCEYDGPRNRKLKVKILQEDAELEKLVEME